MVIIAFLFTYLVSVKTPSVLTKARTEGQH
jgi:hypothetical protein